MSERINAGSGEAMYMAALVESQQLDRKEHAATRRTLTQTKLASMGIDEATTVAEYAEMKRDRVVAWIKSGLEVAKAGVGVGKAAAQGNNVPNAEWSDKWAKSPDKWTKGRADGPRNLAQERKALVEGSIEKVPDVPLTGEDQRKQVSERSRAQLREQAQNGEQQLDATKGAVAEAVEEQRDLGRKLLEALDGQLED